jgi:hypothetical protein
VKERSVSRVLGRSYPPHQFILSPDLDCVAIALARDVDGSETEVASAKAVPFQGKSKRPLEANPK